ncbi:outer membrane beta-barrel protein [Massilia sp. IC2-477]|uniref:outer membrane beta-barrel protein n=1 Tax=Massilia sp. IC2-477 TaxID=2887198 RepID=UPI001D12A22F|nr:outer membrane beta-barrel protein [Massilia sp. IC2-477]MCC2955504.1 outer membrane beta-barrel protein [Massilia sp. IC2-477]
MQKVLAVLFAGFIAAGAVHAAEPVRTAPQSYVGVGVSSVDYVGAATKASPKVFTGYQIKPQLALEAGAVDLKNGYGMYIAVKPSLPLSEKLSAYGKVGVGQTRRQPLPAAPTPLGKKNDTGAYGAFGLQYSISPNAAVTLEVERLPREKPSALKPNVWTLALQFLF